MQKNALEILRQVSTRLDNLLSERLRPHGLTACQQLVMLAIRSAPLTQVEIGAKCGADKSTVTNVLIRLEERGLVTRTGSQKDGRSKRVALTPVARRLLGKTLHYREDLEAEIAFALGDEGKCQFIVSLNALSRLGIEK